MLTANPFWSIFPFVKASVTPKKEIVKTYGVQSKWELYCLCIITATSRDETAITSKLIGNSTIFQQLVQANNKGNIKALHHWLCEDKSLVTHRFAQKISQVMWFLKPIYLLRLLTFAMRYIAKCVCRCQCWEMGGTLVSTKANMSFLRHFHLWLH